MAERRVVGNLIKPRPIPPFTAATTTGARWIDGTAGGSATDLGYGWYEITGVGNMAYSITEEGLTIAATTATGRGRCVSAPFETTTTKQNINQYGIPVTAGTSYTLTYKAKGTNILANAVRVNVLQLTTGGTTVTTTASTNLSSGDSDWTTYSVTFTPGATVAYVILIPIIATAGNIMSATFKDFKLDTTTPTTRTTATSRTTASNRVAVRDMGTALRFDGSGDYVNCGDIGDPLLGSLSVSGFFNANTGKGGRLVGKRDAMTGTEQGYDLTLNTNGTFRTYVGDGTVGSDTNNISASHNTGIWKHFAYVIDRGKNLKILYINGVAISSVSIAAVTGSINYAGNLFIGATRTGTPTNFFIGLIDEPRIWNRALSATEIQNLYLYNVVPTDGLVAEYLFDEATGTTAIDSSGNGNDGTITGATYTTDTPLRPRTSV